MAHLSQTSPQTKLIAILSLMVVQLLIFDTGGSGCSGAIAETNHSPEQKRYGILGQPAPELKLSNWIDGNGNPTSAIHLRDLRGKVIYLYFFQDWCPGCHSHGFPTLQTLAQTFDDDSQVVLLAIQTAFEGKHTNTLGKLRKNQIRYNLTIPMAHDGGHNQEGGLPETMIAYRSGGTPWAVIIDPDGKVVYNKFHIDAELAINMIQSLKDNP